MRLPHRQSDAPVDRRPSVVVPFPVPRSDIGLVKALRAGHPDAVRVLCEQHSGYLLRLAARILGPDEALVAVVAEAMRRSLEKLDRLHEPRALRAWLVCQLIVAVRHRLRARRRWHWLVPRKQVRRLLDGQQYSDRLLASYRVLDCMNDGQRIVFCLVVIHSMSLTEVAAALAASVAEVRHKLERASKSFAHHSERESSICMRQLQSA